MGKSKKYFYDGDQIYDSEETVDSETLSEEILNDPELSELSEIVVGCWGESYDNNVQPILDSFVDNKEKFQHIESLFIGDMDYEECEVSWIEQGDYSKIWQALPNLKRLKIKGCNETLTLGKVEHNNLQGFEIICGGLRSEVIKQIAEAKLPSLLYLNLYFGVVDYGFDGGVEEIRQLLQADFIKHVQYLGLGDSEIQDEIVEEFFKLGSLYNIKVLDFSNGTLTDKGGQILLDNADKLKQLDKLDLTYHYLSEDMMQKLKNLGINVILDDPQSADEYGGELWYYPMLTE